MSALQREQQGVQSPQILEEKVSEEKEDTDSER